MFKVLINECKISFKLRPDSPISIRSGDNNALNPVLPESRFIRSYRDGEQEIVIPGSSLKGVFRSRAERLLKEKKVCDIFGRQNECESQVRSYLNKDDQKDGKKVYKLQCPVCKTFGGKKIKSRIEFKDSFPEKDTVKLGIRYNVGIDRVKGAAIKGALFDPEILEDGIFPVDIYMKNIFKWQLKLIISIINDMNEGYVTIGGVTTRGFGKVVISDITAKFRDYRNYGKDNFERIYAYEEINELLKNIAFIDNEIDKESLNNEW